jgi:prepilin-type N-terminal cleavage/methylation domain-containing protein
MVKRLCSEEGFSLVEVLVVIVMLGILFAIAWPNFFGNDDKVYDRDAQQRLERAYKLSNDQLVYGEGCYPEDRNSLAAILEKADSGIGEIGQANRAQQITNEGQLYLLNPHDCRTLTLGYKSKSGTTWVSRNGEIEKIGDDYVKVIIDDAPTAWWRLGDANQSTAADETGDHPGQHQNGPGSVPGAITEDSDTAISFNPSQNQHVNIPDHPALRPGADSFSAEVWFKKNGIPSSFEYMLSKSGSGAEDEWDVFISSAGRARVRLGNPSGNGVALNSSTVVTDNLWHHLVLTVESGGQLRLYIDGSLSNSTNVPSGFNANQTRDFFIGARTVNPPTISGIFDGDLDEAAFYRYVLTPPRISLHYSCGANGLCSQDE